ncbi:MAG: Calx-beta domain-containing protein, partial [Spirulina sp.]
LTHYAPQLQEWRKSLSKNTDILLYGCNVARSSSVFLQHLHHLTGANIAASANLTGSATLQGDWNLDVCIGKPQTPLAFQPEVMAAYPAVFSTIAITEFMRNPDTVDSGDNNSGGEYIELFNYGSSAVDINGWTLVSNQPSTTKTTTITNSSFIIPSGGYVILARNKTAFQNAWGITDPTEQAKIVEVDMTLRHNGDQIDLKDSSNTLIWQLNWGDDHLQGSAEFLESNTDFSVTTWTSISATGDDSSGTEGYQRNDVTTDPSARTINNSGKVNVGSPLAGTYTFLSSTPDITINDVTVNENAGTATFTVSLSATSTQTVTVDYATANNTATAGSDYTGTSGTVSFAAGDTSKTVTVNISEDALDEANETFFVNLSNATNGNITDTQGMGTINDNDAAPTLSIDDVTVNENAGTASFTVSLSAASGKAISVDYATANNTAIAGSDYTNTSGTLNFAAGETSKSVTVNISEDTLDEANETFLVNLTNPSNATIADTQGQGTINDNDATPTLSINDVTVNENAGTASFTVSLSAASGQAISVDYATANGTATAGSDYTNTSGTLNFAAGETSKNVTVNISEDTLDEANETFLVNLTNPTNATIADTQGMGTINDNDATPTLSINDVTVNENAGTASFTVSLSAASGKAISVDYATANNTAIAGSDYTSTSGTLNFATGETSKNVTVNITNDAAIESDETFVVNLTNPTNATIADSQGQGTITDEDIEHAIAVNTTSVTEGDAGSQTVTFTITRTGATTQASTVDYNFGGGAVLGTDFNNIGGTSGATTTSGTVSFAANETAKTITIDVPGDTLDENNESVTITLSNASIGTIATNSATTTIVDDDNPPTIAIGDVTVNENAGTASFSVSLSAASGQAISVDYATANDTATAGNDYTNTSGTLNFAAGDTSKTVTVNIANDTLDELDETFFVNLSNPSNVTFADSQGIGTITDNDAAPTLSIGDVTVIENAGTASFTVSLSAASGKAISVDYATANDTATAGSDYTNTSGTLNFAAGETSKTVTVNIANDTLDEADETFFVTLSNPSNATFADSQGIGTLTDDDAAPTISIADVTVTECDGGTTTATFTVSLSAASGQAISVDYATADNTATAGSDYTAATGTLNFAAGETSKTIDVTVTGDTTAESDETFFLNLTNPSNTTIADSQGLGTIADDDIPTSVTGSSGTDTLTGTAGNDILTGFGGSDTLTGGDGDDQFVYNHANDRQDTVTDFIVGEDTFVFTALFDTYGITAATLTDAIAQSYIEIVSDGAGGSIIKFDSNGDGGWLDWNPAIPYITVQGVSPADLTNDANFVLQ